MGSEYEGGSFLEGTSPGSLFFMLSVLGALIGLASFGFGAGFVMGLLLGVELSSRWHVVYLDDLDPLGWPDLGEVILIGGLAIVAFLIAFFEAYLLFELSFWRGVGSGLLSLILFPIGLWMERQIEPKPAS